MAGLGSFRNRFADLSIRSSVGNRRRYTGGQFRAYYLGAGRAIATIVIVV
jgi:hypothetical protein